MSPLKIGYFADNFYPELSGIADTILLTGTELARRGHEIHYFVPHYSASDYKIVNLPLGELKLPDNMKIHRSWSLRYPTPTKQGRASIPNILRGFEKNSFDLVHSQSFFGPGLDALLYSRLKKVPLIGTNHTIVEEFVRYSPINAEWMKRSMLNYVSWYYNRCAFVSTPSNYLAREMKKRNLKAPINAVSNPVDVNFFDPGLKDKKALKRELGFFDFVVLYTGRISPEKGIETLFSGFVEFSKNAPEAMLVLVGGGVSRKALEKKYAALGLSGKIKFLGPYLGEAKKTFFDIYRASDVFATASTSESQCMSMLQALAAGLPVIGAAAAALPEYIDSGHGFLFRPGDHKELAVHLKTLYESEAIREHSSKNARQFARQFSVSEIASRWENIYNRVVKESRR